MTISIEPTIELEAETIGMALENCDDPKQFAEDIVSSAEIGAAMLFAAGAFAGLPHEAGENFGVMLAEDWGEDVLEPVLRGLFAEASDEVLAAAELLLAAERKERENRGAPSPDEAAG